MHRLTEAAAHDVPRRFTVSDHTEALLLSGVIGMSEETNKIDNMISEDQLVEFCQASHMHIFYLCLYIAMIAKTSAGATDCLPDILYVPPVAIGRNHKNVPYAWCTNTEMGFVHTDVQYRVPARAYVLFILNIDRFLKIRE
jgi:hypothetical protein